MGDGATHPSTALPSMQNGKNFVTVTAADAVEQDDNVHSSHAAEPVRLKLVTRFKEMAPLTSALVLGVAVPHSGMAFHHCWPLAWKRIEQAWHLGSSRQYASHWSRAVASGLIPGISTQRGV